MNLSHQNHHHLRRTADQLQQEQRNDLLHSCILGGPGVGKSTFINTLLHIAENGGPYYGISPHVLVAVATPTGTV